MIENNSLASKRFRWNRKDALALTACLLCALFAALFLAAHTGADFFSHSSTDSYTLQALAWRRGEVSLGQDYPWLELAVYEGDWYVSFAPVPTIPMLLLSFFFGEQTPNALMNLLYFLSGLAAAYALLRRYMLRGQAAGTAAFAGVGGSLMDIVVSQEGLCGAVWYQAQLLAFCLTMLAFCLMDQAGESRWKKAASLILIALSVGCRPLNAVYVPLLLWMLWESWGKPGLRESFLRMIPYIAVPALIAAAYAGYNFCRFGNPLEFGQSYLPEFVNAQEPMLSLERIWRNFRFCLRLPQIQAGVLSVPVFSGFAVYLTNPMFDLGFWRMGKKMLLRNMQAADWILGASILVHALLLLTHRTNGGWQYGTRYLSDCVPALVFAFARGGKQMRRWEAALMGMLTVFNLLATLAFHGM